MRSIRIFGQGRPHPPKIELTAETNLTELLKQFRSTTYEECSNWSTWARSWGKWSVGLAILSALGSGAAGATVASISTLSPGEKALVVLLAFGGAALGGIAAAVGAPNQAKVASLKADQLASLERWASLAIVELPTLTLKDQQQRVSDLIAWRDQIFDVTAPASLNPNSIPTPPPTQPPGPGGGPAPGGPAPGAAQGAPAAAPHTGHP
jgi:hypothetical protein